MSRGDRVLVVDDDHTFRESVVQRLRRDEFGVRTTERAAAARDRLDDVNCVLSGYDLPDATGLDLLSTVRDRRPDLPFVLCADTTDADLVEEAFDAGVTDYVRKRPAPDAESDSASGARADADSGPDSATAALIARRIDRAMADTSTDGPSEARARPDPEEYHRFLDAIGDPTYMTDADGHITAFNQRAVEMAGYDREAILGEHVSLLLSRSDIERGEAVIRELLSEGGDRTAAYDITVETADGDSLELENHVALLTDGGEFHGTIGVLRRRTDRTNTRLRQLHDATRELVSTADADDIAEQTVQAAKDVLGQRIATIRLAEGEIDADADIRADADTDTGADTRTDTDTLVSAYSTDEAEAVLPSRSSHPVGETPAGAAFAEGEPRVERDLDARSDGHDRGEVASAGYFPLGDHGVLVIGATEPDAFDESDIQLATVLAANAEAALDRAAKEARLRTERDDLEALFENIPDPTIEVHMQNGQPIVERLNPAFEEVFGYTSAEVVGENLDDYIVPSDDEDATGYNERIQTGESFHGEVRRRTEDGLRDFILHVAPHDVGEDVTRGYAIYTDITEQKQRERELARQNERLDQFASVVSHDLRNPLSVAKGRLDLARTSGEQEHFDAVEEAHDRMDELINGLLALARQGELTGDPIPVDVESAARNAWSTVETDDLELAFEAPPVVAADPERLRQLLENLFRNAVDHADGATTITVGSLEDCQGFFVEDDGVGIPPEERETVLESGYSGDSGTGFGLAIVDTIAEAHGWEVGVTESDTGGARFEFYESSTVGE